MSRSSRTTGVLWRPNVGARTCHAEVLSDESAGNPSFLAELLPEISPELAGYLAQPSLLEAVRRICRGHLILLEKVSRPLDLLPVPLVQLDARRGGREWFGSSTGGPAQGTRPRRLGRRGDHVAPRPARARSRTQRVSPSGDAPSTPAASAAAAPRSGRDHSIRANRACSHLATPAFLHCTRLVRVAARAPA